MPDAVRGSDFERELRLVAAAWGEDDRGDREALTELARRDPKGRIAARHRAGPGLHRRAERLGLGDPSTASARDAWRRQTLETAARQMVLDEALSRVAATLRTAGVPWAPLKGLDLISRGVYDPPEERPTTDVDILLPEDRFDDARRTLRAAGWQGLADGPRAVRYLRDEGYAWQATDASGVLLEVHFRLWAQVHPEMPARLLGRAVPDPILGGGLRLDAADAWLIAAVHVFTVPPPRGAGHWRDLAVVAQSADLAAPIIERSRSLGLQAQALLAADTAASLWPGGASAALAQELRNALHGDLGRAERSLCDAGDLAGATLPLRRLVLARHRAGRPARHGLLHAVGRRLWPHAGVVEAATAAHAGSAWPLRRLRYQLGLLRGWIG